MCVSAAGKAAPRVAASEPDSGREAWSSASYIRPSVGLDSSASRNKNGIIFVIFSAVCSAPVCCVSRVRPLPSFARVSFS